MLNAIIIVCLAAVGVAGVAFLVSAFVGDRSAKQGWLGLVLTFTAGIGLALQVDVHLPRDSMIESAEDRYEITVERTPSDLFKPGQWRIDGEWRTCFLSGDKDERSLRCADIEYAEFED